MTLGFSVSWASQKKDSLSSWCELGELIEGIGRTSSSNDSLSGSCGELESSNLKSFRDIEESNIVGDGSNNGDDSGVILGLPLRNSCTILGKMPGDS